MASCLAAFEPYPITNGYGSISTPWSSANNDAACYQQPGVLEPYPTGVWVPESLACDYLAPGVTRVLSVTDRCPYNMRLRSEWAVRDFVFVKEIGTGNASTVWYAFCKKTSAPLAIKTYKKRKLSPLNRCQVAREINIHSQLDHPNIIALYAAFEDNDKVYLLQEYAEGGDLFDEMKRTMGRMPENQLVTAVLLPMMSALLAMHSAGFIHRDIKPENTLFAAGRVLKLADFGLAVNHLIERPVTRLGTLDYMAPEVLVCPDKHLPSDNKERSELWYTPAVDAWALGVLAYELAVGRPPFGMSTRDETIKAIRQCPPSFPEFMSPGLVDYISHALVKPADQRSTLADLMQHPWIMEHARRAGMDAQVLAYLRVHQPAERQLLTSAVPAIGGAAMQQQQQQQQIALAGAPAGPAVSPQQLRAEHDAAAVAPAAAAVDATAISTAENVMPVLPNVTVAAPLISGSLNAAAAAVDSSALSPSAAAAATSYLAGLVAADPQMLMLGGTNAAAAAATAAAAGMAASGGQARVKRTAKRTGMPRCYSSRNVPGLSSMASMGGPHQPGIPHGVGHIHWHANGEALALHVPGLALDLGGSDSPRSSSQGANSPTAAAAVAGGARGVTRAASMMMPLYLQQQLTPQQQSLQQEQDGYNPLLGGLTGLIPGLAGMQAAAAAAAAAGSQQALLPGSPTRRALAAARLNGGSNGSGGGSKQNSSSKRCTPEPDSDLAAALVTLGQSSPCSVDLLSPQLMQQQQQLMQQYLRQQQTQLAAAGSAAPVPVAAAAAMHCQGQLGSFVSPNASPKPLSRSGPAGLSSSGSTAAALPPAAAAGCSGVGAMLAQQQQQLGQYGAAFSNCSCGSGPSMCAAASAAGSSSGRSSGTRFSPCSPILKVMTQHQFESPLKRVNSQGTINGGSGSGDRSAAVQLTPQRSLPIPLPPTQQQLLLQKQAEQQQQVPGVLLAADLDRLQHAAAAATAAAACHSAGTPSPTAAAAAAAGCSVPCHRTTGSSSFEGSGNSGQASSAGLHMHELADVLSSPGSMANLWSEHQQQQQEAAAQQYLEQQQMAAQQQQQLCNRKINIMRPVMRACSAPSLLHPALQLQLLQQQQQQQQQQGGMGGCYDGLPVAAAAADLLALEQQQQCNQQQQQQQQYMAASPFSLVNASLNLSIMDCGTPASPAAAAAARANSLGTAVAADQQVQMLTSNTLTNQRSGPLGLQGSGNLNGVITSHLSASLPPTPFYGASSPGLALLQQQGSTGQQQQQQLRQAAASWEAAAAAALAAVGSPHAMQPSPAAAAAVYGTAAELSLIQQHSSSGIESLSQPARASGISRSHSLLSELGPLQPVPESSAATYEQLPPALTTQSPSSTSWQQQQQQLQDIAGVLLYQQQQQQQAAQVAAVQLQMCGAAGLSSSSMADVIQQQQQQQQLVGVGVGVGCVAGQPPASPVNPRFSSRHAPSRLAHVSSPSVAAAAADVAGDAQAGL